MVYMTPRLKKLTGTLPLSNTYPLNSVIYHTNRAIQRLNKWDLSSSLGKADFLAEQVPFKTYLPNGQGSSQDIF